MENHRREGTDVDKKVRGVLKAIDRPVTDINHLVKKIIDKEKRDLYASCHGRPDQIKGLRKEVSNGTL
jgi:uncharacterized protein YicC (UPF0701 family)